jgi:hypothetical protein
MDFRERFDSVSRTDAPAHAEDSDPPPVPASKPRAARMSSGKFIGLVLGCVVVGVMLFMMFAVLGELLTTQP